MIQIKFGLGEEVFYFDVAEQRVSCGTVESVHVIPKDLVKLEDGRGIVGSPVIVYQMSGGDCVPESGVFSREDELIGHYASLFGAM